MNIFKKEYPTYNYLILFALLSFLLYGNTLKNKYCLDDAIVITQNNFTKKGIHGIADIFKNESFTGFFGKDKQLISGARYRPLSIATFAIEYQFLEQNPAVSHLINIILYALTAFLIYLVFKNVFHPVLKYANAIAFICALLFIFHPIHNEVVANIKGRDEILALLFSFWSTWLIFKYVSNNNLVYLIAGSIIFLTGLFSKENSIVFLVLTPLIISIYPGFKRAKLLALLLSFSIATLVYLVIRNSVIGSFSWEASGELMNNPFVNCNTSEKYATIFVSLLYYLKLLLVPHPLTFDYYPYHISISNWNEFLPILSILTYTVLITISIITFNKKRIISIATLLYLIPLILVSNLFFPIGTFLNERFAYFSSLGYCLIAAYFIVMLYFKSEKGKKIQYFLFVILITFAFKTISRNRVWYNDYTLFTTDVKTSYNSAKSNCSAGGALYESTDTIQNQQQKQKVLLLSLNYLKKSLKIHPTYIDALILLGDVWYKLNILDSAILQYKLVLKLDRNNNSAIRNIRAVTDKSNDVKFKIQTLKLVLEYDSINPDIYYQLGKLFGQKLGDLDKSILYLSKAASLNKGSKHIFMDLGVAYGLKKNYIKAEEMLENALKLDKNDFTIYQNLFITNQLLGNKVKALKYYYLADSIKKNQHIK